MVLSQKDKETLLSNLQLRFKQHMERHKEILWNEVKTKLEGNPKALWSLHQMEITGGEPDVVGYDLQSQMYLFFDCAPESPIGRRSLCYDADALASRKKFKPENSAVALAETMGITLLNEAEYKYLQQLGNFDTKTSSWLQTPATIRNLGGALFGDFRFDTVFIYHNGAESYYAARGFRGVIRV
ncbi:MAG: DUF4256 domain-containing protein [Flavobacteriaceae bacterium]